MKVSTFKNKCDDHGAIANAGGHEVMSNKNKEVIAVGGGVNTSADMARRTVERIIQSLNMILHPEGGYYVETYRSDENFGTTRGSRSSSTAIYFLLGPGDRSHLHRIKSDEMWFYHCGNGPLHVVECELQAKSASDKNQESALNISTHSLGNEIQNIINNVNGNTDDLKMSLIRPQHLVKAGTWFGSAPADEVSGWALVSCVVSPGFDFEDFELATVDGLKRELELAEVVATPSDDEWMQKWCLPTESGTSQ